MKLNMLFNGFRHSHIQALYKKVAASDLAQIAGCLESHDMDRQQAVTTLGAVFSDRSYEEWLHSDIDAVAIGNAYGDRGDAVIRALEAGKHVIADKPICTTLAQLDKIRELSEKRDCKIACMLDLRYLPQTQTASDILHSGRLGEVRSISMNGQHCLGYATRPTWYFEAGMHGGTINDLAIHGIDLVRMLTGQEFTQTDAARVWNAYAHKHPHFKDCAQFMARLENGAGVMADVSYSAPSQGSSMPTYWEFRFWCERGLLTFHYNDPAIMLYEEGCPEPIRIMGSPAEHDYLQEFAAEIQSGSRTMTENVLRSTQTALLIQQEADRASK